MENLLKILIVDDEYLLRQGLRYLCNWEEEGFTIIGEASNGEEALHLTKTLNPDIVITDIVMPEMDGIELTKLIKSYNSNIKIIVLSSYSDFEYVKTSFKYGVSDYILKPKLKQDELLPILKKLQNHNNLPTYTRLNINKQVEDILDRLSGGFNCPETDWQRLNQYFPLDSLIILISTIDGKEKSLLDPISKEYFGGYIYSYFLIDSKQLAIIINFNNNDLRLVTDKIKQFTADSHSKLGYPHFAMSMQFKSMNDFKLAIDETKNLLTYHFFLENTILLTGEHVPKQKNTITFDFDKFYKLIESLDINAAKSLLIDYINMVSTSLDCDVFSLKKLTENVIYNTMNIVQKQGFNSPTFNSLKLRSLKNIDAAPYTQSLVDTISSILDKIFKEIDMQPEQKNMMLIKKITSYVEEHYHEQIYLSSIADKLYLNYSYLSSYFNNYANESFTDYLNKVRITKAKEFLKDPSISISEVSELVGYTDQSYFGKVFKKSTGISPSAYRKKHRIL